MTNLSFSGLPLSPAQLKNLESLGYHSMTDIQAATLPKALAGKDLIAQAKTGSGKTAAFALPVLARLNPRDFAAQALILCPTRELAAQVAEEIRRLTRHQQNIKVVTLCGGQPIGPQIGSLEKGAHIVVGTPGRLNDHLSRNTLVLERVAVLVLDEADRMLEMGFQEDIERIIAVVPQKRQTLMYSATYPDDIEALSQRLQRQPERVTVEAHHAQQDIQQAMIVCRRDGKREALRQLLGHYRPEAAVIFCNTKDAVRDVQAFLTGEGVFCLALHGDMEQRDRDQVLIQFRQGAARVLVATDVAARGLDIDDLPAVVNFDLPHDPEQYVHRIGRTGRAGKTGLALSLFSEHEAHKVARIGAYQSRDPEVQAIEKLPEASAAYPEPDYVCLCINGGRKQKVRPGDVLGALTRDEAIPGNAVGKIDVVANAAYVAIERKWAARALAQLQGGKIKGRKFLARTL